MTDQATPRAPAGPGAVSLDLNVSLEALQRALIRADHPLGHCPEWTGLKTFLVIGGSRAENAMSISVIRAKNEAEAEVRAKKVTGELNHPHFTIQQINWRNTEGAAAVFIDLER